MQSLRQAVFCLAVLYCAVAPARARTGGQTAQVTPNTRSEESHRADVSLTDLEGKRVIRIEWEGLKRIEKEAVLAKLATHVGSALSGELLRLDIQSLYSLSYFDDIAVYGEELPAAAADSKERGVLLTFVLKERPVISSLVFEGNDKIDTSDLKEATKLKEWAILDENQARADVAKIQKLYEDKGFFMARVRYELEKIPNKSDEIRLVYRIEDFDKVQVKRIQFINNHAFSDEQLKNIFEFTKEGHALSFVTSSGNFRESAFKQDLQRLILWYLDHGYVKFRYENPVVSVSEDKRFVEIAITVDEGDPYSIGKVGFSGDMLFPESELRENLKMTESRLFKISERNLDLQNLTEKYQDLGYAFVNVMPKIEFREDTHELDVEYVFEKGKLVYFGEINVTGNSKTHDKVVRRELRIHEGELYSGSRLRLSRERVERLGYFAPGEIQFNSKAPRGKDDVLDIEIVVKERTTGSVQLGLGYGSFQGAFLMGQIQEINLFGRGHTLSFQTQVGTGRNAQQVFSLGFTEPYFLDTLWSTGFEVFSSLFPVPRRYTTRKLGFSARVGYPLADDLYFYLTYKNEGMRVDTKTDPRIDASLDQGVLSSAVLSMIRDKRNNRLETTSGNYQSASLETAGLGGDKKFFKLMLNNRFYSPVVGDLVFRMSTEYGHMLPMGGAGIPNAERFFLGGQMNMRGYNLFTVGPKGTFGEPLGGTVQLFALNELEYPLIREVGLKGVAFVDIGNAFAAFPGTPGNPFSVKSNWGLGVRWFSPIGPLRFEWGFPFSPRAGEDASVFQFFIGPPF